MAISLSPDFQMPFAFPVGSQKQTATTWFPSSHVETPEQTLRRIGVQVHNPPQSEFCSICRDEFLPESEDCLKLSCCVTDHYFHADCILSGLQHSQRCPNCTVLLTAARGTQPPGTMILHHVPGQLPGEQSCESVIVIAYSFPSGIQGPEHPHPGTPYTGTSRRAFLPGSQKGFEILLKFLRAWDARLLFTIGMSVTTGQENTVIWNGIHHKTNVEGGPSRFGFPDATYLSRVEQELAAAGIV